MTWQQHTRRAAVIDAALGEVNRAGPEALDGPLTEQIAREFDGLDGFLPAVAQRWFTAFGARLDDALERAAEHDADESAAAAEAWHELAVAQPAAYRLLRAYAGHPALRGALARQVRFLASVTGLSPDSLPRFAPAPVRGVGSSQR